MWVKNVHVSNGFYLGLLYLKHTIMGIDVILHNQISYRMEN